MRQGRGFVVFRKLNPSQIVIQSFLPLPPAEITGFPGFDLGFFGGGLDAGRMNDPFHRELIETLRIGSL